MAYRDDLITLEARRAAITAELEELGSLELAQRLVRVEARIEERRLAALDAIESASPCDATWEVMEGDDVVRRCHRCDKNVYDLGGLSAEAAIARLAQEGDPARMRLHRRRDGTVITADCANGRERHNRRGLMLGAGTAIVAAALFAALSPSFDASWEPVSLPRVHVGNIIYCGGPWENPAVGGFDEETFLHGWQTDERWSEPSLMGPPTRVALPDASPLDPRP